LRCDIALSTGYKFGDEKQNLRLIAGEELVVEASAANMVNGTNGATLTSLKKTIGIIAAMRKNRAEDTVQIITGAIN